MNNCSDLSVVIPLYNKEKSIQRAVNSVLNQTMNFKELIIIDDGSTDNSLNILLDINDARVKIISQSNQGVSSARNAGVKAAQTAYVCFLDADDEWHPCFLDEISRLITQAPHAAIFCVRYDECSVQGQLFVSKLVGLADNFSGQLDDFFQAYRHNRALICSSNICVNIALFNEIGGFPTQAKVGEDIYFWLRLALKAPVMFSSVIASRVYYNAENRTPEREPVTIPFQLVYFLDKQQQTLLNTHINLKKFILYNAFVFCFYASYRKARKKALKVALLLIKYHKGYAFLALVGACLPRYCLDLVKYIRDRKTLTYE